VQCITDAPRRSQNANLLRLNTIMEDKDMKLITPEYAEVLAWEHANTPGKWGQTARMYVSTIVKHSAEETDWLDYGAGSGGLNQAVQELYPNTYTITEYEPSRPDTVAPDPKPYVACIDVLEHIEPGLLHNVLKDLARVTVNRGYFTISCRKAAKILKDGRNAHLIVENHQWWKDVMSQYFTILEEEYEPSDMNFRIVVSPRELNFV